MVRYTTTIHTTAKRELDNLDTDERERLTDAIVDVAEHRQPTQHSSVTILEGQDGLYRLRVGDLRAVLQLDQPELKVLRVGHRANVYDVIDEIDERRASA